MYTQTVENEKRKIVEQEESYKNQRMIERQSLDFSNPDKQYRSIAINTDLTFNNSGREVPKSNLKEKVLKDKLSKMNTGGVGTSTKIGSCVIYDPNKPLFPLNQGFKTLDQVPPKFLQDYLHLINKVEFTPKDEKKFNLFYKNYRRGQINIEDPKSLNKFGKFDLTNELKERKRKEWWAKLKFRLLKLINEQYSYVARALKTPRPKERTKNQYFDSLFNQPKLDKVPKSIGTEPDVLSILEGLKRYYDRDDERRSTRTTNRTENSLPPLSSKNVPATNELECIPENDYKTTKNKQIQNAIYFKQAERSQSKQNLTERFRVGISTTHNKSIEVIKTRNKKGFLTKSQEGKNRMKFKSRLMILDQLSDSSKNGSPSSETRGNYIPKPPLQKVLQNPYESFLDDKIETRSSNSNKTGQGNNQIVPSVSPVPRKESQEEGPQIKLVNSYEAFDIPKITNIKCTSANHKEAGSKYFRSGLNSRKSRKKSQNQVFRSSESPLRRNNIITQQSKQDIVRRLAMENSEIKEKTKSLHFGEWNKPINDNFIVRSKKEQRRKEYWNLRVLPPDISGVFYK